MPRIRSNEEIDDIIKRFTIDLEPIISISERYRITRQAIYKILKRNDIDPQQYGKIEVSCFSCGTPFKQHRSRVRRQKHVFCNDECYNQYLKEKTVNQLYKNRNGQRAARKLVGQYFPLTEKNVVHHKDKNCSNNEIYNLQVFENNGNHIRFHRGFNVEPIWDGNSVTA